MKQAMLFFCCDLDCDNESDPATSWAAARKAAKADGWVLSRGGEFCPDHAWFLASERET